MEDLRKLIYGLTPWVLSCVTAPLIVAQIVLFFFFKVSSAYGLQVVRHVGHLIWGLSAIFGVWPIIIFHMKGRVEKGKHYMHTTKLVDSGIYSIVRHPQYLAGVLISLALILMAQHWLITLLGVPAMVLTWVDALKADQYCTEKFGAEYRDYMQRVPRLNLVTGIVRLVRHGQAA